MIPGSFDFSKVSGNNADHWRNSFCSACYKADGGKQAVFLELELLLLPDLSSITSASPFCVCFSFLILKHHILHGQVSFGNFPNARQYNRISTS